MPLKNENPRFSESISTVIKIFDNAVKDMEWNDQQVVRMDQLTQDYLHSLELDILSYSDRAKLATKISRCRRLRRDHKDMVMSLAPLVDFLKSERGNRMMKDLRETLGQTRKIEKYMETRKYYPRIPENERP